MMNAKKRDVGTGITTGYRRGLLSVICFCMLTLTAVPQVSGQSLPATAIDSLMRTYSGDGLFSGSILVSDGQQVFSQGYGLANRSWEITNRADTRYEIASLTKPFTALLVLQIVDEGRLLLKDPLSRYLPEYDHPSAGSITIRQLLTHTSGIPNFTEFEGWQEQLSRMEFRPTGFVSRIAEEELDFEPGSRFSYSNSNYFMLGLIIEKVTGRSYGRVLQEQIVDSAGLGDTGYRFNRLVIDQMATGYERLPNGVFERAPYQNPTTGYAASGIYSTVEDLYRFEQLLYGNQLIPEVYRNMMMSRQEGSYGFGWVISYMSPGEAVDIFSNPFDNRNRPASTNGNRYRVQWHWGNNPGFNSLLIRFPDRHWSIIILENQTLLGDPEGTRINQIAAQVFGMLAEKS